MNTKLPSDYDWVFLDDEGVGRCHIVRAAAIRFLNIDDSALAVGLRAPKSGRTDMHPDVVRLIKSRYGINISNKEVRVLQPEDIKENTIVVLLTESHFPDYLRRAKDIIIAPIIDPGDNIKIFLDYTATKARYIAYLLELAFTKHFDGIGNHRTKEGLVAPRYIVDFEPENIDPEYSYPNFGSEVILYARRKLEIK